VAIIEKGADLFFELKFQPDTGNSESMLAVLGQAAIANMVESGTTNSAKWISHPALSK
jgi:hypothetical protein